MTSTPASPRRRRRVMLAACPCCRSVTPKTQVRRNKGEWLVDCPTCGTHVWRAVLHDGQRDPR